MNNVNASSGRTTCANAEQLERYLNDQMDPHEEAQIESHLSVCTECQHALEAAGGNADWWSEVRTSVLSNPAPEDQDQDAHESTRGILNLLAPTDDPEMLGRIGHYEVQGVVGEGSTGVVLRAVDPRLHRVVAIKVLAPTVGLSGPARQRFEREARAVAAVVHDHVVPIYSVDEHQGLPYIVMPYVSGSSLGARIQRDGPLGTREAARVGFQVARALAAAHALGIVHRDVKPANVLVEGSVDRVAVTDFGLASVAGEASMTYSGTIQGTPHYMSPEQARGDAVDPRTDLFSLGSLLYEACTGHPPFQAQTVFGVIRRVCETEPKPIRAVNPDIDEWLEVFVARLMSKQLDTRFQSAHEVAEALGAELAYMQNPSGTARPPRPWWPQLANKAKPFPSVLALSCAALLIAAGGVVALTATQPAPQATARNHAQTQPLTTQTSTTSVHTHRVSQSVPMISGGMLTVRLDHGAVRIVAAETDEITLDFEGVLEAATDDQAAMFIERHSVALAATDVGATLTGLISDTRGWAGARYTLTVPVDTSLDIESDASEVTVGDVSGDIRVLLESGDIQLGHMRGRVDARSNHGNIVMVDGCDGDADLVAIRGSAVMANVSGRASAITSGGDIWLGQSTGRTGAQTAGGNIYVDGAQGSVRAHATGGDVLLWINETPTEDLRVNAANGSVLMMIAENVDAIVEASGDLQAELTFTPIENTEDMGGLWSAATLNAGGPALRASSMTGSVDVRVLESLSGDTLRSVLDRLRQRDDTAPTLGGLATSTADTPSLDHNYTQGLASSPGSGDSTLGGSTPGLGGSSSLGGSAPGLGGSSSLGGSAPGLGGSSTLGGSAPGLGGSSSLGGSAPGLGGSSSLGGSAPGLG
ncbi:MAG: protein kinase, partial [Planctomycetota bacterium]